MNNINNVMSLMDTSGMLLARNVMASGISKYDFYQFIRNNKLEKFPMVFICLLRPGKILRMFFT